MTKQVNIENLKNNVENTLNLKENIGIFYEKHLKANQTFMILLTKSWENVFSFFLP